MEKLQSPERAKHYALSGLKESICLIRRELLYVTVFCPFRAIKNLTTIFKNATQYYRKASY